MGEWTYCPFCRAKLDGHGTSCPNCGRSRSTTDDWTSQDPSASSSDALRQLESELRESLAPQLVLLDQIGQGGMGIVYLARDPALKRLVVVKVLAPALAHDDHARKRFAREAESTAAVSHPNVINIYQVGELPKSGTSYFVMQHVDGPTLAEEFSGGTPVPESRARRIIGEIASALAAAHSRGVVHRDIKPSNIMLDRETDHVIVLDFGISAALSRERRAMDTKLTAEGSPIGTPQYMSPEQAASERVTDRTDVYSLGVVAFELLVGSPPFEETTPMAIIAAHINRKPPSVSDLRPTVDAQFAALIDSCLAKEATARPSTEHLVRVLLPPKQAVVEWPPPGTDQLAGLAAALVRSIGWTEAMLATFFLLLLARPRAASPGWLSPTLEQIVAEGASDLLSFGPIGASMSLDVLGAAWVLLVALAVVPIGISAIIAMRRAWRVIPALLTGLKSGYPASVLWQVGMDSGQDTVDLKNGSGIYAALHTRYRSRFLRLRNLRAVAAVLGASLAAILPLAWLTGIFPSWGADPSRLLSVGDLAIIFAPPVGALVVMQFLSAPEDLFRRRFHRATKRRSAKNVPNVQIELAAAWVAGVAGGNSRPRSSRRARLTVFSLGLITISGLAAVFGVASVAGTAIVAQWTFITPEAASFLQRYNEDDTNVRWWPRRDSLFGGVIHFSLSEGQDIEAARTLLAAWGGSFSLGDDGTLERISERIEIWDFGALDPVDVQRVFAHQPRMLRRPNIRSAWSQLPALSASTVVALARDTTSPRLALWRRFARSAPLPPLWFLKPVLPAVDRPGRFRESDLRRLSFVRDLTLRNEAAAVLEMWEGDVSAAHLHIQENVAVAQKLLSEPFDVTTWSVISILEASESSLRAMTRLSGDSSFSRDADVVAELRHLVNTSYRSMWGTVAEMVMANPIEPVGLVVVADTTVPPFQRWGLVRGIANRYGFCFNAREIVFGISQERQDLLARATQLTADIKRSDELGALLAAELLGLRELSLLQRLRRCSR